MKRNCLRPTLTIGLILLFLLAGLFLLPQKAGALSIMPPDTPKPSRPYDSASGLYYEIVTIKKVKVAVITACSDSAKGSIVIPETLEGYPVTRICSHAFAGCDITEITIPGSINYIEYSAFVGCSSLEKVHVSDLAAWCGITFESIDASPLFYAKDLYLNGTKITDLVIPEGVKTISYSAFSNCSTFESITLPDSLTTIARGAFRGCKNITSVTFGTGIQSIEEDAFYGCEKLERFCVSDLSAWCRVSFRHKKDSVPARWDLYLNGVLQTDLVFPEGVSVGPGAFQNCKNLTSVTFEKGAGDIGDYAFFGCENLTSVTGNISRTIGDYAFSGCTKLTTVTAGKSVSAIGDGAFSGCRNLVGFDIPRDTVEIGDQAFQFCEKLTKLTFLITVKSVGKSAFEGCTGLTEISFKIRELKIGQDAFKGCKDLTVRVPDIAEWCNVTFGNASANPLHCAKAFFVNGEQATDIAIPRSVTFINSYLFAGYRNLKSVTIPDRAVTIQSGVFADCTSLTSITIPNSVKSFGPSIFSGCTALQSVTLSDSMREIPSRMFWNCTALTNLTIPEKVTKIKENAFYGCTALKTLNIPKSVTEIQTPVFSGCSALKSVYFNGTAAPAVKGSDFTNVNPDLVFYFPFSMESDTWYGVPVRSGFCNKTADDHAYGGWTVTKEATEHEDGLKQRICSLCNHTEEQILPKLPVEITETSDPVDTTDSESSEISNVTTESTSTESTSTESTSTQTASSQTPAPAPAEESAFPLWAVFLGGGILLIAGCTAGWYFLIFRKKNKPMKGTAS